MIIIDLIFQIAELFFHISTFLTLIFPKLYDTFALLKLKFFNLFFDFFFQFLITDYSSPVEISNLITYFSHIIIYFKLQLFLNLPIMRSHF